MSRELPKVEFRNEKGNVKVSFRDKQREYALKKLAEILPNYSENEITYSKDTKTVVELIATTNEDKDLYAVFSVAFTDENPFVKKPRKSSKKKDNDTPKEEETKLF